MKREIFRRGVRMTHVFGTLEERSNPWETPSFNPHFPERVSDLGKRGSASPSLEIQTHGEHRPFHLGERSAVVKPNGRAATLQGPAPNPALGIALEIPVSTKRRREHA